MGILRVLLAISVVFIHTHGQVFVGGQEAVQLFYVISGYLISFVLLEVKSYKKIQFFYLNRYLRLYPTYLLVTVLVLITYWILGGIWFIDHAFLSQIPLSADLVLSFANAFIFLQDWVMFMGVKDGHLILTGNLAGVTLPLYKGLLTPQAWTLGVELTFYLIAPFVLTRRKLLYSLLLASILLRIYFINLGIGYQDPWVYRFFPTELALFLSGALAHQVLMPFYIKIIKNNRSFYVNVFTCGLIIFVSFYSVIQIDLLLKKIVLFSMFILLLPFIFLFQKQNKFDSWIGELSYPIYINHFLVMFWVESAAAQLKLPVHNALSTAVILCSSIVFAIVINATLHPMIDRLRAKIRDHT